MVRGEVDGLIIGARNEGLFAVAARLAAVVLARLSRRVLLHGRRWLSVTVSGRRGRMMIVVTRRVVSVRVVDSGLARRLGGGVGKAGAGTKDAAHQHRECCEAGDSVTKEKCHGEGKC